LNNVHWSSFKVPVFYFSIFIYLYIYLFLTAIGLTPGGSSTVHIWLTPGGSSAVHIWLTPGGSSTVHIWLTPGGSSAVHIYTQTVHRIQRTEHTLTIKRKNLGSAAVPRLCELYPAICLTTAEKARKNLS
jgi:hypothetical protein